MTRMRIAVLGTALAAMVLAGVAVAADYGFPPTKAGLAGSITPKRVGTPKNPKPARLHVRTTLRGVGSSAIPATVDTATVWFPHGAIANGRLFPSCNARKLDLVHGDRRACPKASRIGSLRTLGYYADLKEPIRADLYNTRHGKAVLFYFFGDKPVIIRQPVIAPLTKLSKRNRYGYKLFLRLPETLQDPVPGTWASFRDLRASAGKVRKIRRGRKGHRRTVRRGYIETFRCPRSGHAPIRIDYTFLDGQKASATAQVRCRQPKRRARRHRAKRRHAKHSHARRSHAKRHARRHR